MKMTIQSFACDLLTIRSTEEIFLQHQSGKSEAFALELLDNVEEIFFYASVFHIAFSTFRKVIEINGDVVRYSESNVPIVKGYFAYTLQYLLLK